MRREGCIDKKKYWNIGITQPLNLFQRINDDWPILNLWLSMEGWQGLKGIAELELKNVKDCRLVQ